MMYLRVSSPDECREQHPDEKEELFRQKVQLLWKEECLVDVTLACEDKLLTAHKLVLSAYSDYFKDMFTSLRSTNQYPIVFMRDIQSDILEAILQFMYCGEVNVTQNNLNGFIKTARILKIKGLSILEENPNDLLDEPPGKRRRNSKTDMQWTSPTKRMKGQRQYEQNEFEDDDDLDSFPHSFTSNEPRRRSAGSLNQENISHHIKSPVIKVLHSSQRAPLHQVMESQSHIQTQDTQNDSFSSDSDDMEMPPPEEINMSAENQVRMKVNEDFETELRKPLEAVEKSATMSQPSKQCNIPIKNPSAEVNNSEMGSTNDTLFPPISMDLEDETKLMSFIDYMSQITPLTPNQLRCFALGIDTVIGSKNFGTQGPCSKNWLSLLKRKYPKVKKVLRLVDFLKKSNLKATSLSFKSLADYLIPLQEIITAFDLGDKPDHFWSCCEYTLNLSSPPDECLLPSRERFISERHFPSINDYVSLMLVGSASGEMMSPFMVFKGSLPAEEFKNEGLSTAMYDKNSSGFMDPDLILKWFEHTFLPQCPKKRSEDSPVVLLVNSSFAIAPQKMLDLALRENVILLSLMPHLHHACEPLDNVFAKGLRKSFLEGFKREKNPRNEALANCFPRLIKESFEKGIKQDMVAEGFRICGVFPLSVGVDQKAYLDLRRQLKFNKLIESFLDQESSDGDVDKLMRKQNRYIRHLRGQNNDATTSDEEEEFGDSNVCYVCGKDYPKKGEEKWVKCSKKSCKNFSCDTCLPDHYDEKSDYICIDCNRH